MDAPPTIRRLESGDAIKAARLRFLVLSAPVWTAATLTLALHVLARAEDLTVPQHAFLGITVLLHLVLALAALRLGRELGLSGRRLAAAGIGAGLPVVSAAAAAALAVRASSRIRDLSRRESPHRPEALAVSRS